MNMTRSVGISAGMHFIFLIILAVLTITDRPAEIIAETIRIRIKMQGQTVSGKVVSGGEPSGMPRESRMDAPIPRHAEAAFGATATVDINRQSPTIPLDEYYSGDDTVLPLSAVDPLLDGMDALDPVSGMEHSENSVSTGSADAEERWSVSWSNGRNRGILGFPDIEAGDLPDSAERLSGVEVSIRVSPAGDVISATVIPPGSGDIRIDRYLHNKALEVVLEPGFTDEGDQEGILRLVFIEERQ